jgi:RhtB (resistance to homoserine/threonine) family protein
VLDPQVLVFTGVAALLTITPGADTFLVIRNVLRGGRRAGVATTFGICCGLFVHAVLSALGLSIVLMHSANAYLVLKWAGALYLMWLGFGSIRDAIRGGDGAWSRSERATADSPRGRRVAAFRGRYPFLEGLATNVLNPKVAVFYLAFLPQFIGPGDPALTKSLVLAGIHFVQGIVWLVGLAFLFDRGRVVLASARARRSLEAVSGAVLLGFGVRLAFENRR